MDSARRNPWCHIPLCVGLLCLFALSNPDCRADGLASGLWRLLSGQASEPAERPRPVVVADDAAKVSDPDPDATHQQQAIIPVYGDDAGPQQKLHTITIAHDGRILAGVGSKPGEIRIFDPDGKYLETWSVPVQPDALGVAEDGTVLVAGSGELLRLSPTGEVVHKRTAPHIAAMADRLDKIREDVAATARTRAQAMRRQLGVIDERIEKLKNSAEELSPRDEQRLAAYEQQRESYTRIIEQNPDELTEEQLEAQVQGVLRRKQRVASISSSGDDVFVACAGVVGYGYDVWRLNSQFEQATTIVSGLRGCCGQMDVQASEGKIYVAENSRHRVSSYDRTGESVVHWGQANRTGLTGFGSCCNPMNVAFGPGGEVFTAESTTGRIKCYTPEGELIGLVGNVKLVPGCKNVAIAVSPTGDRIYMMDLTRTHIVMLKRIPPPEPQPDPLAVTDPATPESVKEAE